MKLILAAVFLVHSWYETQCCSGSDCREAISGEIRKVDGGWMVHNSIPVMPQYGYMAGPHTGNACDEVMVPYGDKRIHQSQDINAHLCFRYKACELLCFYKPDPSI